MDDRMIPDGASTRGSVSLVRRVGATVVRPAGPWTPAVHALLRHLEHRGFAGVPRVVKTDRTGDEILTYLDGLVAKRPWPTVLGTLDRLTALGRWLMDYHRVVGDFTPPADARWRVDVPP